MSRPFCKQCYGKEPRAEWIDDLERANKLAEPLGVRHVSILPEISDEKMQELQAEDADIGPIIERMRLGCCPTETLPNGGISEVKVPGYHENVGSSPRRSSS